MVVTDGTGMRSGWSGSRQIITQTSKTRELFFACEEALFGLGRSVVLMEWLPVEFERKRAPSFEGLVAILYICSASLFFVILVRKIKQFLYLCFSELV